tara:strand:- start:515 stop:841 length:327 start_codon:yes stop_codon:yes gene_type:complete
MNNIEKAYQYFVMKDIDVTIDDGSLYILINDSEGHEVQLSKSEIDYRAELYDDEQENKTMMLKYEVEWDGDLSHIRYAQDFETIEEARIALALHHKRNAVLTVKQIRE